MSELWDLANKVSDVGYKLDGLKCIAEMQGEAMSDNVNSGVSWALSEMLDVYAQRLEDLSSKIMKESYLKDELLAEKDQMIANYEHVIAKFDIKKGKKK
jgi:hypothetical protein